MFDWLQITELKYPLDLLCSDISRFSWAFSVIANVIIAFFKSYYQICSYWHFYFKLNRQYNDKNFWENNFLFLSYWQPRKIMVWYCLSDHKACIFYQSDQNLYNSKSVLPTLINIIPVSKGLVLILIRLSNAKNLFIFH